VPLHLPCRAYFVTICTRDRACLFGHVVNSETRLDPLGTMAAACRQAIPHHFSCVVLDEERS
jgi:putative transposase